MLAPKLKLAVDQDERYTAGARTQHGEDVKKTLCNTSVEEQGNTKMKINLMSNALLPGAPCRPMFSGSATIEATLPSASE